MIGASDVKSLLSPLVGRILLSALAILATIRYGFGLYAWQAANALEKPTYTILRRLANGVELRRYDPYLIAETVVDKPGFRESTGQGFNSCARYIFGGNKISRNAGGGGFLGAKAARRGRGGLLFSAGLGLCSEFDTVRTHLRGACCAGAAEPGVHSHVRVDKARRRSAG